MTSATAAAALALPAVAQGAGEITSITPDVALIAGPAIQLDVEGTFPLDPAPAVCWSDANLPTGGPRRLATQVVADNGVSATTLRATVPASLVNLVDADGFTGTDAPHSVAVTNSDTGCAEQSAPASISLVWPAATLTELSLTEITAGSDALTVSLTGEFLDGAVALVDDVAVDTTFVNATTLTMEIPAAFLTTPTTLKITVRNPEPVEAISDGLEFTVNAAPEPPPPPPPPPPPGEPTGDPTGPTVGATGPLAGEGGALGSVVGSGFGATQGSSIVTVGGVPVGRTTVWRDTRVEFKVPDLPAGTYPVQIIVNGMAITIGEYTIGPTPPAAPIANPVLAPAGGRTVLFDASLALDQSGQGAAQAGRFRSQAVNVTGITSIIWRFGDGTTSKDATVSKTYDEPGNYNASVTVTDAAGRSTTSRQTIRVTRTGVALPPVNLSVPNRVVFDFGSAELRDEAKPVLRNLAKLVTRVGRRTLVGGHTDAIGPYAYNLELSEERARAVRRFLIQEGVSPLLLTAVGYGESKPIDSNRTALGRQRNRRVTLQIARSLNPIKLNGRTAQINQRIATAVLLREQALRRRLAAGLTSTDIQNGTFYSGSFGTGVVVVGDEQAGAVTEATPKRIVVPKLSKPKKNFPFTRRQLQINERISRTAVLRVNALIKRLEGGLQGGDVKNGSITTAKLAPGLSFASVAVTGAPQKTTPFTVQTVALPKAKKGPVTEADLVKDQRRSQAAIRRINILIARFNEGFSVDDFAPGALEGVDVKAG